MTFWRKSAIVLVAACLAAQQVSCDSSALTVQSANAFIKQNEGRVDTTYRLKYHFMAPYGWINDPNGFIYFRDEYHLFYQYNPYNSTPNKIHWGHAKSKDLIKWEHLPVALAPDQAYDQDGVFSGSSIEKDGKLYLMYTGYANNDQVQCIAVSEDGVNFNKVSQNPVIDSSALPPNAVAGEFRDPKVFKRGNMYYVVLVSETKNQTGQVLLYESKDLINWNFKSILLEGNPGQGVMWECPDLYKLQGRDVLVLSPIQWPKTGNDYENTDSVVEFIGHMDWNKGTLSVENYKELDHGLDFYATQSLLDNKNRRVFIAWMAMWGRNFPTSDLHQGWAGAMTLPRELHLKNGKLVQKPVDEIKNYYGNPVVLKQHTIENEVKSFKHVSGEVAVLELTVDLRQARHFWIDVRANKHNKTVLSYDTSTQEVKLDRTNSGISMTGREDPPVFFRKVKAPLFHTGLLHLQIFLDVCSVEVFINKGEESMTDTIYPEGGNASEIRFGAEGAGVIKELYFAPIVF
nr:putative GH32 family protein [Blattella germanica]WEI57633.1 putative GH32 family protein [Blattella germanica]